MTTLFIAASVAVTALPFLLMVNWRRLYVRARRRVKYLAVTWRQMGEQDRIGWAFVVGMAALLTLQWALITRGW